jgi:hypothetical protein
MGKDVGVYGANHRKGGIYFGRVVIYKEGVLTFIEQECVNPGDQGLMGIRSFWMRFQKFDQFRNSDVLHITKVSFSEDVGGWVQILSTFVVIALRYSIGIHPKIE